MKKSSQNPQKSVKILKKRGRPTIYNEKLAAEICDAIAVCTDSLKTICENNPSFPTEQTVREWRWKHAHFASAYARAKAAQAEICIEEIRYLAAQKLYYEDDNANKRVDAGFIQSQRLIVDTEKFIAAKLIPKVYGTLREIEEKTAENEALKTQLLLLRAELDEKYKKDY